MKYNPFNKEINDLNIGDIENLIDKKIAEGWYTEYKRSIPKTKTGKLENVKIAKSISSFANTNGGWIIWGLDSDDKNNPTDIRGIDISEYDNFEDQIAQIINSNINPKPFYHFKKIELENDKIVFIINVEESPTPPYITSSGTIYQRENNESKPIIERYILEKLNEKTNEYYESIERFTQFELGETRGQSDSNQSFLELYLFPLPFNHFEFKNFHTSDFFKKTAAIFYQGVDFHYPGDNDSAQTVSLNIHFNSIYSSEGSLIIRPLNDKNLIYKSTTAELFRNGGLKFLTPIHEFDTHSIPDKYRDSTCMNFILDKWRPFEEDFETDYDLPPNFLPPISGNKRRVDNDFSNHVRFIDGADLILNILIILNKYKAILDEDNYDFTNKIGFRARITESWRKFVFFDSEEYKEKIEIFNLPLSPKSEIEIPAFIRNNGYKVDISENSSAIVIAKFILEGIGLPDTESKNYSEIILDTLRRFEQNNDS